MRTILAMVFAALLFAACYVGPGYRGEGVVMVPPLPSVVILEDEPYYQHGGYFYYYHGDRWSYSRSRSGPWVELPRDRYPHEVRFKGREHREERDRR